MATYEHLPSGLWRAKVRKGGHSQSASFPTQREAKRWATALEAEIDAQTYIDRRPAESMTVGALIDRFESEFAPSHYKRQDKAASWRTQLAVIRSHLGQERLADIDARVCAAFRDARIRGGIRPAVSPGTARKDLMMLSRLLRYAAHELALPMPHGNPVSKVKKPAENRHRERRIDDGELQRLLAAARKSRTHLAALIELALETAMRQGELVTLRWSLIDLPRRIAVLRDTKNGTDRAVPLSTRAVAIFKALPRRIDDRVFVTFPREAWVKALADAQITGLHFHDLRHEAISRLAERGQFGILELSAISGHKTLAMLKRYTHLDASKLAERMG